MGYCFFFGLDVSKPEENFLFGIGSMGGNGFEVFALCCRENVFVLKSGLVSFFQASEVSFFVPPKCPILGGFGHFGGKKNCTSDARNGNLKPLFNTITQKWCFGRFGY